ncbi:hypothetical protein D3C77_677990 [compost metagenome]
MPFMEHRKYTTSVVSKDIFNGFNWLRVSIIVLIIHELHQISTDVSIPSVTLHIL